MTKIITRFATFALLFEINLVLKIIVTVRSIAIHAFNQSDIDGKIRIKNSTFQELFHSFVLILSVVY